MIYLIILSIILIILMYVLEIKNLDKMAPKLVLFLWLKKLKLWVM